MALALWLRPGLPMALPSAAGVRPNSPPQITKVSSSIPRWARSVSSAAKGLSIAPAVLRIAVAMLL